MQVAEDCLVFFFTGFLDSGKTNLICSWLDGERYRGKKIAVIATEEGEEEYLDENYPDADPRPTIYQVEPDEVTFELCNKIEKDDAPDIVFIEWNGSVSPAEFFEKVDVPARWALAASIVVIDASTYQAYFKNMQAIFADYYRFADTVIFNRVSEDDNIPRLRASVKSVNPEISLNFLDMNNSIMRITDHLPYDLSAPVCEIKPEDFGLFYTDALDNVNRYNGKRVTLVGQALVFREMRGRAFALSRRAYTCCADDIGQINLLCFLEYSNNFPAGQWLKVTGQVRYYEDDSQGQKMAIPCLTIDDYAITSAPEDDIIYFS